MKERFQGGKGRPALIEALLQQKIVAHDHAFADKLAAVGEAVVFEQGQTVIEQRGTDNDVFFILNGEAEVFVNNRSVGTRSTGDAVGEMVAISPTARRSATIKAKSTVTVWKVTAEHFLSCADTAPSLWKHVALVLADRLREREKFHRPANETPIMFLGSSVEGLDLAKAIESAFKRSNVLIKAWYNDGVFGASEYTMDDLMKQVRECDFAAFVFGPDDKIESRDEKYAAPRDNVVLELGLFMGKLGRERVFMVKEAKKSLKIPSDLTGLKPVEYVCKKNCTAHDLVGPVRNDIDEIIKKLGAL